MKKHFLLLLMAFISLTGWAQDPVDLSDGWTIQLSSTTATYTGGDVRPTVTLKKGSETLSADNFKVEWSDADVKDVKEDGYTVTVTKDMTHTYNALTTPTAKFFVMMSTATFTGGTAPTLAANFAYNGEAHPLITNEPAATIPSIAAGVAAPTIQYKVNDGEWSATIPTATLPGTYDVKYKVLGTDNYNGIDATDLGTVTVTGTSLDGLYTAPTAATSLEFRWNNTTSAPISQALVTEGVVDAAKGTMEYASKFGTGDWSEWSTTVPTGSAAGSYEVKWKITGTNGYANVAETTISGITIGTATPEVTAATGATTLTFTGEPQSLLTNTGSATYGATSALMYKVRYNATQLDETAIAALDWASGDAIAYENVKGTKAGYYYIMTLVPAGGNYAAAQAAQPTQAAIAKPSLFTAGPAAADLTWNNGEQQLITATVNEDGVAQYYVSNTAVDDFTSVTWTTSIANVKASAAGTYYVYYKGENTGAGANYQAVEPTLIPNVKIKKKVLSVKVNDITKTYDGNTTTLPVPAAGKFTFVTRIEDDATLTTNFNAIGYSAIDASNKNAGTHEGVVTVTTASLEAVSTNYEYTIIPGNLIINKMPVTVTANTGLTTVYGKPRDISNEFTYSGFAAGESATNAFATLPVLTSNAAATNPAVGDYTLAFTKGTLKADGNYEMSTAGDGGYVIPDGAKFSVTNDPDRKLVITVLPHTQEYTGVAESWDNMVEGKDYAVSGLISGDAIVVAPTFSRNDATNFNVGEYNLTATIDENTIVADKTKYPGGIIVNNSTFTITKRVLTATIPQQTVLKNASALANAEDWSVEGLQNGEAKSTLNGTLTLNTATTATGTFDEGIKLTIDNGNYTFKNAAGAEVNYAYGKLLVISADQFVLDPANASLNDAIQAAGTGEYSIQFGSWPMNAKEWYAVVLPFKTSPAELVAKLGTYVIANRLKSSSIKDDGEVVVNFGVEMDEIPAGEPFLIKAAADKNWNVTAATGGAFTGKVIAKTISDVVTDKATFTGTYEAGNIVHWGYGLDGTTADADAKYRWLAHKEYKGDNNWKNPKSNAHDLAPMEAFLILDAAAVKARIYVEDIDENGTTAIKSLSVDDVNGLNVKGWYTVGGMKMQNAPTQKGVYIKDGKKVIIK